MATELLTNLRNIGNTLYDVFMLPGDLIVPKLLVHAPNFAASLGIYSDDEATALPVILSFLVWIILAVVLKILARKIARIGGAIIRTISFRIRLALHNFKTSLVCKLKWLLPRRRSNDNYAGPMVEFDDLDLAVLRSASARGLGFIVSAPELAEQFTLRPAQLQRSLEKLSRNKLLDYAMGSTDGFDNYRLTDSGAAFLAMWRRQEAGT